MKYVPYDPATHTRTNSATCRICEKVVEQGVAVIDPKYDFALPKVCCKGCIEAMRKVLR